MNLSEREVNAFRKADCHPSRFVLSIRQVELRKLLWRNEGLYVVGK